MWDVKACRSCLTVKGKLEKIGDASKRQYTAITGLQITEGDGYPVYFCLECRHHIRKSLAFRRKSRRAHFVLKEIMSVRKQVTYSDIVTVNRKKTNLESSLNYWEPHNNPCYLLANEEGQEDDLLQKYDLNPAQYARCLSKHIIDIQPEIETEIEDKLEEINEPQDDTTNNDIEDIPTNDYLEPEPELDTENIDMNDIFKDLKTEPEPESDNENMEEPEPPKTSEETDKFFPTRISSIRTVTKTMLAFDLKVLTLDEQKKKMEIRKSLPAFARAPYKCAMCLTIYKTMEELVKHVQYHNTRKYGHECQVCKNKFATITELNIHVANCHMYDYTCKMCHTKVYTQKDAVHHIKNKHKSRNNQFDFNIITERKKLRQALSIFEITALTQQMMGDVMLLRSRQEPSKHERGQAKPGEAAFSCDICHLRFKYRRCLENHIVVQHRYMYTCKLCKEVFTAREKALEHNDVAHPRGYSCPECGKSFTSSNGAAAHMKRKHVKYIPCNLCGSAFRTLQLYYAHQLRKHGHISLNDPLVGDPQHKCTECSVQFIDQRSLEWHRVCMNHDGAEMVPLACVPCKKLYETEEELETHFITCRDARKYPRSCCYCSVMLHNSMEYKTHFIHAHPTLPYRYISQSSICDICGKSIFKPHLEAHLRTHSGAGARGAGGAGGADGQGRQCRLCARACGSAGALVAHVLAQHARRPFRCALCTRRFKFRSDCKDHILKIHAPTKLFKCEFCGVEFSYWKSLKEHSENVHNLIIPPVKTKVFKAKNNKIFVYAHMKIIINELERDNVEQLQVELMDYLEQKSKPVGYENYFIFSPDAEESAVCTHKRDRRKNRKRKKPTELESAVAQIIPEPNVKIESIEIVKHGEDFEQNENENVVKLEMEKIEVGTEDMPLEDIEKSEIKKMAVGAEDTSLDVIEKPEVEKMEVGTEDSTPLEVIENEGHQYVMINGEMYRIACEDEE